MKCITAQFAWVICCGVLLFSPDIRGDRLELINHVNLWTESPVRSSDAASVTYHPPSGHLLVADSEITEYGDAVDHDGRPIYEQVNIFVTRLDLSALLGAYLATPPSGCPCEAVGLAYNPVDGYMYGTDDDQKKVYRYRFDHGEPFGAPVAEMSTSFDGRYSDPEGIACDPGTGILYVASGTKQERVIIFRFDTGNGSFQYLGDFPVGAHIKDPEGIAVDPGTGNLFLVAVEGIAEFTPAGTFVQFFDYSYLRGTGIEYRLPGGLTFAPSSDPNDHPDAQSLYITCRGIDNGAFPERNSLDGAVSEVRLVREGRLGTPLRVPADYASISAAVAAADAGDTILVSRGVYVDSIRIRNHPVVVVSEHYRSRDQEDVGATIVDGGGGGFVVRIDSSAGPGTVLHGLTLRNADDGVRPYAPFTMAHCRVSDTSDGIDYERGGGLVQYSRFHGNRDDGIDLDGSTAVVIEHCVIDSNGDDGVEIRLHPHQGALLDVTIRNCSIRSNAEDGIQLIDYGTDSPRRFRFRGNFIVGNAMAGVGCMADGNTKEDYSGAPMSESVHLINNTFLNNRVHVSGGANVLAVNNLFVGAGGAALSRVAGASIITHNLIWASGEAARESNVDTGSSLMSDPLLNQDMSLQGRSPAIDAGIDTVHWAGRAVMVVPPHEYAGSAPDLGAFEH